MTATDTKPFGCAGTTIRLRSGRYFDLADPRPDQFTFADIAGGLSKLCRFGGQVIRLYTVAEHCWHCRQIALRDGLSVDAQRAVLMHDAAEAFAGDVVKPLKVLLSDYAAIECRIEAAIGRKFDIDFAAHAAAVQKIDREMLIAERRSLFSADQVQWTGEADVRRLTVMFECWHPELAERYFELAARDLDIDVKA